MLTLFWLRWDTQDTVRMVIQRRSLAFGMTVNGIIGVRQRSGCIERIALARKGSVVSVC